MWNSCSAFLEWKDEFTHQPNLRSEAGLCEELSSKDRFLEATCSLPTTKRNESVAFVIGWNAPDAKWQVWNILWKFISRNIYSATCPQRMCADFNHSNHFYLRAWLVSWFVHLPTKLVVHSKALWAMFTQLTVHSDPLQTDPMLLSSRIKGNKTVKGLSDDWATHC